MPHWASPAQTRISVNTPRNGGQSRSATLEAAQRAARQTGIPSYDSALIEIYGEPDFDDQPA